MSKRRRRHGRASQQLAAPIGRGTLRLGLVLGVLVIINLYVFLWRDNTSIPDVMDKARVANTSRPSTALVPEPIQSPEGSTEERSGSARWVDGVVQSGDSMGQILRREGLTPPEADRLIRAIQPHLDLRKIQVGQKYRLQFNGAGTLRAFEFEVSKVVLVRAERGADGTLSARRVEAETELQVIEVGGDIDSSLYASIKRSGESGELVSFFVDVFAYDINFYIETQKGDTFRMLVEKEFLDGEFYRYGRVLAAEYSGKVGTYHAFWWQEPGADKGHYYDSKGRSVEKTLLKTPLKFARVSSKFNPRRMHPVLHRRKGHWGVDYAAPTGTPIWAAAGGKITARGRRGGAGNAVTIKHDNGMETVYMHLSKFAKGQRVGQRVQQKAVIGYVGATGLATGPHLHFGIKVNGKYVDPAKLKMKPGRPVPRKHWDRFQKDTTQLVARLSEIPVTSSGIVPAAAARVVEAVALALPN